MPDDTKNAATRLYPRLRVCTNLRGGDLLPSCGAVGSKELAVALKSEISKRGDFIMLETVHCMGRCHIGPTLKLLPFGPFLQGAQAEDAARLVSLLESEDYEALTIAFPDPTLDDDKDPVSR